MQKYINEVFIFNLVICDTDDWLRFRNSCYKVEGPETCHDVPEICEKYQAELVEIWDSEEAMFINNTVKDKGLVRVNV
jgi:hypothetical protein